MSTRPVSHPPHQPGQGLKKNAAKGKAKLDKTQVRGPSARNKAWLIDKINGGLTVRAKRALGNKQAGGGKRARTAK